MKPDLHIPGGYILYPRHFLDLLDEMPLLDRVLWTWLNCRANHKEGDIVRTTFPRRRRMALMKQRMKFDPHARDPKAYAWIMQERAARAASLPRSLPA